MEQKKIWSRMKKWIRPASRGPAADDPLLRSSSVESVAAPKSTVQASEAEHATGGGVLARLRRNDPAVEKLQQGYLQVIDLVESIQKHQQRQDTHAVEISSSLSRMADTLSAIDAGGREQAQKLLNIADELRAANQQAEKWSETFSEIPRLAEAQRQTLTDVARQMEAVGERDSQMAQSLDSFREAVTSLGDATTASTVAVKSLQMSTLESHERAAVLMREQNKRFMMLFVISLVLVATAIVTGLIALWGR